MKLLFVHRKQRPYGNFSIENYFQTLTSFLEKEIKVSHWKSPYYSNGLIPRWKALISLKKYTNENAHDIVHICGDTHFLIWGVRKAKKILTIHDLGMLNDVKGLKYHILKYFWLTGPVSKADAITCVSESTKQDILKHCPNTKNIIVIPTVIDPRFQRSDKLFNEQRPVVLLIGSAPNKNLKRVLRATRGLNIHLSIIAKLDQEEINLLSGQSYDVNHSISFDKLLQKYMSADIVSLCSTLEGFGMPIIEAQAIGRVVITSNCSSMPAVAGKGALFVDPYSENSIRGAFIKVMTDSRLRENLIEEGFLNVKRFSARKVANQYLDLYKSL